MGNQCGFDSGTFKDPDTGLFVAVDRTAYGDGIYLGSDGTEFPVDAGVIGVVPLELVKRKDGLEDGKVIETPGTVCFEGYNGLFKIDTPDGSVLTIDTSW